MSLRLKMPGNYDMDGVFWGYPSVDAWKRAMANSATGGDLDIGIPGASWVQLPSGDYQVVFDGNHFVPAEDGYEVEFWGEGTAPNLTQCECGLDSIGSGGTHSSWCPKGGRG